MISRRSSGSRRDARAVEPTMSQNMTVSWRRSAADAHGARDAEVSSPGAVGTPAAGVSAAPQSPQNFLPGGLSRPHSAQRTGSGAAQSPQNLFPSGLALPQLGQSMPHL